MATDVKVYFCDPQSPWQRGSNENTNGLLRQYFPKNTDLTGYSQSDLNKVALRLNQRPPPPLPLPSLPPPLPPSPPPPPSFPPPPSTPPPPLPPSLPPTPPPSPSPPPPLSPHPPLLPPSLRLPPAFPIESAEEIVKGMPNPPAFEQDFRAAYFPSRDTVTMPSRTAFETQAEYYSTLFHELTHSTGHVKRLGRRASRKFSRSAPRITPKKSSLRKWEAPCCAVSQASSRPPLAILPRISKVGLRDSRRILA